MQPVEEKKTQRFPRGFIAWFSRHYMLVINLILALFILFTVAAPVCMYLGWDRSGRIIYLFYRQFCHQFAFRSWFLFGRQLYYPKQAVGDLLTYTEMFGQPADDLLMARAVVGNEIAGYKIAICQRDLAMYGALLLFGFIFALSGNRIPRIPLLIWLVLAVLPLGIDGLTQLSSTGWNIFGLAQARESTPLLRSITGGSFGFFSGWYIYPSIQSSFWVKTSRKN